MAGGNLADCSASATAHTGDSALINRISDDCSAGSQQSKTGKVTICHDAEQSGCPTSSESDYFTMLEDSFSSDPMLAGLAVQNGLWDDLTETDELMTTAMSFSGSQLAAKTAGRVKKNIDSQSQSAGAAVLTSANTTCRSYHAKAAIAITSGRPVDTSDVTVLSQPAIG